LIAIFLASSVQAAPPKHLPPGQRTADAWCFDLEESKTLLKLDSAHTACLEISAKREKEIENYDQLVAITKDAVKVTESSLATLKAENERLFKLWKDENLKRHEAENKPNFGAWIGWATAAVMTGVLGGVVLAQ